MKKKIVLILTIILCVGTALFAQDASGAEAAAEAQQHAAAPAGSPKQSVPITEEQLKALLEKNAVKTNQRIVEIIRDCESKKEPFLQELKVRQLLDIDAQYDEKEAALIEELVRRGLLDRKALA